MTAFSRTTSRYILSSISAFALFAAAELSMISPTVAADVAPKDLLKAMSDYLGAQEVISFNFDTDFEIVTTDRQKLLLASSGAANLQRPDKIRASRSGGFANVEMNFDGKTLTVLGKDANLYAQAEVPGSLDHLIDELRDKYQRPLPGADLLLSDVYKELMANVTDVKDLGSGA